MNPIRLKPVYKETIWASSRISDIRGLNNPAVGIAREVCAYHGSENEVLSAPFDGEKISDVIRAHHDEILGGEPADQLVRVAYMGSAEDLSIQVHPNEEQARTVGDYEKSESWYILEADPGATIVAGIDPMDKESFTKAAMDGSLEKHLHHMPVKAGDFVYIPANLVHANGKHMLVLEIGSYGGITYRIYDYGRGRSLDIDKSYAIMNPDLQPALTEHPFRPVHGSEVSTGVDCRLFHVDVIDVEQEYRIPAEGGCYALTCVSGSCSIGCGNTEESLDYTQTILIPAACPDLTIHGKCRILRSWMKHID